MKRLPMSNKMPYIRLVKYLVFVISALHIIGLHAQTRSFSPWIVPKNGRALNAYIDPIIERGVGDHISLFVKPENYTSREWKGFIEKAHAGGIHTVYMSVSGSEKSFDTPSSREKTVDNWIKRARKYKFDGVDMDIENLSPSVRESHLIFLKYVSQRLHQEGLRLAMAVGFYPPMMTQPLEWWYDPEAIGNYCDHIRLMLYGQYTGKNMAAAGSRPDMRGMGPTCSYSFARNALEFWLKNVPKDKLTVNIPAFSTVFYPDPAYPEGVHDEFTRKIGKSYYPVPQDIDASKPHRHYWSWIEQVWVYVYTSSLDGRLRIFYASDEDSTQQLLQLMDKKGILHLGMWTYTGELIPEWNDVNQLVLDWCKKQ